MSSPCDNLVMKIDPAIPLNAMFKAFLAPINYLTKKIFLQIKLFIEYWNDIITRISLLFQQFVISIIFTINGFLKIFNIITNDLKQLLKIWLGLIHNHPDHLIATILVPYMSEVYDFFLDSVTIDMFVKMWYFDFTPLKDFFIANTNLAMGKTVKPTCRKDLYGTNDEKEKWCHEYTVPKCRTSLRTIYNMSIYFVIILYFSGWMCFLKIFYPLEANFNILQFIKNKFKS